MKTTQCHSETYRAMSLAQADVHPEEYHMSLLLASICALLAQGSFTISSAFLVSWVGGSIFIHEQGGRDRF